jgi:hypothetical protein
MLFLSNFFTASIQTSKHWPPYESQIRCRFDPSLILMNEPFVKLIWFDPFLTISTFDGTNAHKINIKFEKRI